MSTFTTDRDLLRAYAKRGDADAFAALVRAYQDLVWSVCRRQLGPGGDAEAATQETFLKLATHARTIRGCVGAWLHRCALNVCRDQQRRDITRERRERTHAEQREDGPDWPAIEAVLDEALAELGERDRELIVQHYLVGRSQKELAAAEGVTPQVVHRRVHRAVDQLRTTMQRKAITLPAAALALALAGSAKAAAAPATLTASLTKIGLSGAGVGTSLAAAAGVKIAAGLMLAAAIIGGAIAVVTPPGGATVTTTPTATPTPAPAPAPAGPVLTLADLPADAPPDPDAIIRVPGITPPTVEDVFVTDAGDVLLITDVPANVSPTVDGRTLDPWFHEDAFDNWGNRYRRFYTTRHPHPFERRDSAYQYYLPVGEFARGEEPHRLRLRYCARFTEAVRNPGYYYEVILDEQWIDLPDQTIPRIPDDWPGGSEPEFWRAQGRRLYAARVSPAALLEVLDAAHAAGVSDGNRLREHVRYGIMVDLLGADAATAWFEREHLQDAIAQARAKGHPPSSLERYVRELWLAGRYEDAMALAAQLAGFREAALADADERQHEYIRGNWMMNELGFYEAVPPLVLQLAEQPKPTVAWIERTADGRVFVELKPTVRSVQADQAGPVFDWQLEAACHASGWEVLGRTHRMDLDWQRLKGTCEGVVFVLQGPTDATGPIPLTLLADYDFPQPFGPQPKVPWTMTLDLPEPSERTADQILAEPAGLFTFHVRQPPDAWTELHRLIAAAAVPFEVGLHNLAVGPLEQLVAYTKSDAFAERTPTADRSDLWTWWIERATRERAPLMLAESLIALGRGEEAMAVLDDLAKRTVERGEPYTCDISSDAEYLPTLIMQQRAAWVRHLTDVGDLDAAEAALQPLLREEPQWAQFEDRRIWEAQFPEWPGREYAWFSPLQRAGDVWKPVDVARWRLERARAAGPGADAPR